MFVFRPVGVSSTDRRFQESGAIANGWHFPQICPPYQHIGYGPRNILKINIILANLSLAMELPFQPQPGGGLCEESLDEQPNVRLGAVVLE